MLFDNVLVLAKVEVTEGTDPTPAGSDAILTVDQVSLSVRGTRKDREEARPYAGAGLAFFVGKHIELTFTTELAGSGAAGTAPNVAPLLQASRHLQTVVASTNVNYKPQTVPTKSVTLYLYHGDNLWKITGCYGSFRLAMMKDDIPKISWRFLGRFDLPEAATAPTPTWTNFQPPVPLSKDNTPTFTFHGLAAEVESFEFDCAFPLSYDDRPNRAAAKNLGQFRPTSSITLVEPALATKDFRSLAASRTTGAIQVVHGASAGKIIQFDGPAVQVMDDAEVVNLSGEVGIKLNLNFVTTGEGLGHLLTWK